MITSRTSRAGKLFRGPLSRLLSTSASGSASATAPSVEDFKHGVSVTSLLVASVRGREKTLFRDPYASHLAGPEGDQLVEQWQAATKGNFFVSAERLRELFLLHVTVRHRFFDDFIIKSLRDIQEKGGRESAVQFVNLASGLDSRPYRLPWPSNTTVFEIDRQEVINFKNAKLGPTGARPICKRHVEIGGDVVVDDWEAKLIEQGFDKEKPSVWLTEGLLAYLSEDEADRLLKRMRAMSVKGSSFCGDWTSKGNPLAAALSNNFSERLKELNAPLKSFIDDPEAVLKATGWDSPEVHVLGDDQTNYGVFPHKPLPRWMWSFTPRHWIMTAKLTQ